MLVVSAALLAIFWDAQIVRWVVWVGLVVLTIALLLLIRTRWGQSQPLGKCVVLSLIAHLLLAIYISTVNIVTATVGSPDGKGIQLSLVDGSAGDRNTTQSEHYDPWNALPDAAPVEGHDGLPSWTPAAAPLDLPAAAEPTRAADSTPAPPIRSMEISRSEEVGPPDVSLGPISRTPVPGIRDATQIEPTNPQTVPDPLVPPPEPIGPAGRDGSSISHSGGGERTPKATAEAGAPTTGGTQLLAPVPLPDGDLGGTGGPQAVPDVMQNRVGNHSEVAKGYGATQESEAAVNAALRFFANNQTAKGNWDARRLGGGAALAADRQDRNSGGTQAGMQADTAISGLALLAFLAAGNTHLQGSHQSTVRHGLEYLLASQQADGSLGASTNIYEKMYSHGMATCALSEAYAMSRDERLRAAVERAIGYSRATQDRASGGWRYYQGQAGDTSQLGWQVMALKSAQLAGIPIPDDTRRGIQRFLRSVTDGREGGLARYQPANVRAGGPTRPMTAEALVCRQFLGIIDTPAALDEATRFVLDEIPGSGVTNHYYWYYASLAMYQLQGESWRRWNEALQKQLIATQRQDGDLAGSWNPDPVWGGCGGRGYSTALATLSLEVYYRFLPLYVGTGQRTTTTR